MMLIKLQKMSCISSSQQSDREESTEPALSGFFFALILGH